MSKYNDLWKPPKDMISNIYNHPSAYGKRKKKRNKQKSSKQHRMEKIRKYFLGYFHLHEYAPNSAICHSICNKLDWEMPDNKNQYSKFMRKAYARLSNEKTVRRKYTSRYKTSDEFYKSNAWRHLRYLALKNSEGCCNLCGARAADGVTIHVDHIKPRSKYPEHELDLSNLQVLCEDCNFGKSNIDETNWKQYWESILDYVQ